MTEAEEGHSWQGDQRELGGWLWKEAHRLWQLFLWGRSGRQLDCQGGLRLQCPDTPLRAPALIVWPYGAMRGKVTADKVGGMRVSRTWRPANQLEARVMSWQGWTGLPRAQAEGMDRKGGFELHFLG